MFPSFCSCIHLSPWYNRRMKVTRTSMFTGITRTIDLPITEHDLRAWNNGMLIQNACPDLTADEREFIMTGVTSEEWEETFSEEA